MSDNSEMLHSDDSEDKDVTLAVYGLARMEDHIDAGDNVVEDCCSALLDSWPIQEVLEDLITEHIVRQIFVEVLKAHKQAILDGNELNIEALTAAVKLIVVGENLDIALSVLSGRCFVAGYEARRASEAQAGVLSVNA